MNHLPESPGVLEQCERRGSWAFQQQWAAGFTLAGLSCHIKNYCFLLALGWPLWGGWWSQYFHDPEASQFSSAVKCCVLSDCVGICTLVISSVRESRGWIAVIDLQITWQNVVWMALV